MQHVYIDFYVTKDTKKQNTTIYFPQTNFVLHSNSKLKVYFA